MSETSNDPIDFQAEKAARAKPKSTARGPKEVVNLEAHAKEAADREIILNGGIPAGRTGATLDVHVATVEAKPSDPERMAAMRARASAKPKSTIKAKDAVREPLLTAQNVSTGVSCIMGGLLGLSAWSHVMQGLQRDEEGKMDTGKLTLGAIEGLLTAGIVFLAVEMRKPEAVSGLVR